MNASPDCALLRCRLRNQVYPTPRLAVLDGAGIVVSLRMHYDFGGYLGYTEFGKASMAQWYAVIDICTAALPIGVLIRKHQTSTSAAARICRARLTAIRRGQRARSQVFFPHGEAS